MPNARVAALIGGGILLLGAVAPSIREALNNDDNNAEDNGSGNTTPPNPDNSQEMDNSMIDPDQSMQDPPITTPNPDPSQDLPPEITSDPPPGFDTPPVQDPSPNRPEIFNHLLSANTAGFSTPSQEIRDRETQRGNAVNATRDREQTFRVNQVQEGEFGIVRNDINQVIETPDRQVQESAGERNDRIFSAPVGTPVRVIRGEDPRTRAARQAATDRTRRDILNANRGGANITGTGLAIPTVNQGGETRQNANDSSSDRRAQAARDVERRLREMGLIQDFSNPNFGR